MKSKEEIINEMFNECGGNIFHTIHDVKIISSFMERYAIEKQLQILTILSDSPAGVSNLKIHNAISELQTKLKSL